MKASLRARISSSKDVYEDSHYLGIPLEVRLYFNPRRRWFFLAGGEWNYQLARQVKVDFNDPNMKIFTEDIKALVGGASGHYGLFYMGAGVRLGGVRPRWTLGFNIPLAITATVTSLNTPQVGGAAMHVQYLLSNPTNGMRKISLVFFLFLLSGCFEPDLQQLCFPRPAG